MQRRTGGLSIWSNSGPVFSRSVCRAILGKWGDRPQPSSHKHFSAKPQWRSGCALAGGISWLHSAIWWPESIRIQTRRYGPCYESDGGNFGGNIQSRAGKSYSFSGKHVFINNIIQCWLPRYSLLKTHLNYMVSTFWSPTNPLPSQAWAHFKSSSWKSMQSPLSSSQVQDCTGSWKTSLCQSQPYVWNRLYQRLRSKICKTMAGSLVIPNTIWSNVWKNGSGAINVEAPYSV